MTLEVQALERSLHCGRIILCSCSNDSNSACHLVDARPILVECCLGVTFLSQEIKNTNKLAFTTLTRLWAVSSWDPREVWSMYHLLTESYAGLPLSEASPSFHKLPAGNESLLQSQALGADPRPPSASQGSPLATRTTLSGAGLVSGNHIS